MDATTKEIAVLYCVAIVILGSFFLMNLILAVIMDAFKEEGSGDNKTEEEEEEDA